ncbi:MAG: phosphoribosylglycinamide formyltransferase [Balneolaceae bacterium]|nr:MAG: phosphoribosylglycinamide formyltransferase [Balneolaceae bacterium]
MKKLVVFASGSGSNFQAIIDAVRQKKLNVEIAGLITNRDGIGAIERAIKNRIPVNVINETDEQLFKRKLADQLKKWQPDLIVLAGFLKKIPAEIVNDFPNKIINIHPALLPKFGGKGFYGLRVHEAVINSGEKTSGCTVHYVNNEYDRGQILEQKEVPVYSTDSPESLAKRVLKAEHELLPSVIKKLFTQTN